MSEARTGPRSASQGAGNVDDGLAPLGGIGRGAKPADLGAVTDEIKGAASDLTGAAVEQGRQFLDSAKAQATSFVDERKNAAAQSVAGIAASLRSTGESFGEQPNIKAFVGSAAEGLEQLATELQDRSFADLFADAEAYARRSPVTVGAVTALAGFLLARFIKSSADEMSEASHAARSRAAGVRHAGAGGAGRPASRRPASLDI